MCSDRDIATMPIIYATINHKKRCIIQPVFTHLIMQFDEPRPINNTKIQCIGTRVLLNCLLYLTQLYMY